MIHFIVWIIVSGFAGFVASKIINKTGSGLFRDILIGIVGGFVGDFVISNLLGLRGGGLIAEVIIAIPDAAAETNHFSISIPYLGSLIATMRPDSKEVGLTDYPRADRPPVAIPFFAFRIMVGCGLIVVNA